jgi:hypothetical protein
MSVQLWEKIPESLLLCKNLLRPGTLPMAEKRLVAMTESTGSCAWFSVKRPLGARASFPGTIRWESAFPRPVFRKAAWPGTVRRKSAGSGAIGWKSAFSRTRGRKSTFPRTGMRKALSAGTAIEVPSAATAAKRRAERLWKAFLPVPGRPVRRLADQNIDFLFQEVQLLLHLSQQRYNVWIGLGRNGKFLVFVWMFAHVALTPFASGLVFW